MRSTVVLALTIVGCRDGTSSSSGEAGAAAIGDSIDVQACVAGASAKTRAGTWVEVVGADPHDSDNCTIRQHGVDPDLELECWVPRTKRVLALASGALPSVVPGLCHPIGAPDPVAAAGRQSERTDARATVVTTVPPPPIPRDEPQPSKDITLDVKACIKGTHEHRWLAMGSTYVEIVGPKGADCIVKHTREVEGGVARYECNIPRKLGVITLANGHTSGQLPGTCKETGHGNVWNR